MKVKFAHRRAVNLFDLEAGELFVHSREVYLATPFAKLADGRVINAVKLATGTLFSFPDSTEVERFAGTLVEDDLAAAEVEL